MDSRISTAFAQPSRLSAMVCTTESCGAASTLGSSSAARNARSFASSSAVKVAAVVPQPSTPSSTPKRHMASGSEG